MDFLNRVTQNSKGAARSVSQTLDKVGMSALWENDGKKKIEYIDISKMEGAPTEWNRYPLLRDSQPDRYLELKLSIYERGLKIPLCCGGGRAEATWFWQGTTGGMSVRRL